MLRGTDSSPFLADVRWSALPLAGVRFERGGPRHSVRMGKALLGLAMASVLLRSYIGLSPWKLALLLLSLFVLNLLQVSLRRARCGQSVAPHRSAPQLRLGTRYSQPVLLRRHV